jgi:hypothetical protein
VSNEEVICSAENAKPLFCPFVCFVVRSREEVVLALPFPEYEGSVKI